jgi:hypothetical protein
MPFQKGKSGNPGGRPAELGQFRALCREATPKALRALKLALKDPEKSVAAAKVLLEFGWGKPTQSVSVEHSLSDMTDEQLEARYRELIAKAEAARELDS